MNLFDNFIAVPSITVLCYILAEGYKNFAGEELYKHIPVLCGVVGMLFGVGCFLLLPGFIPAENVVVAAAIGAVSGWAATGVNQIVKQQAN